MRDRKRKAKKKKKQKQKYEQRGESDGVGGSDDVQEVGEWVNFVFLAVPPPRVFHEVVDELIVRNPDGMEESFDGAPARFNPVGVGAVGS